MCCLGQKKVFRTEFEIHTFQQKIFYSMKPQRRLFSSTLTVLIVLPFYLPFLGAILIFIISFLL